MDTNNLPHHIIANNTYYTQFVIRYEKNTHITTNYRRGDSLPINTPIRLLSITHKIIDIEVISLGQALRIKNVEKHTGDDTLKAFDKLFASTRVDLSPFNALEKRHINKGTIKIGMRKKAVTTAIGYPPITQTPHLSANQWVYWSHRFNKFKVIFKKDKISSIVD